MSEERPTTDGSGGTDEATAVPPPPIETAPSATGVVAGDGEELAEAPPAPDAGEGR